MNSIQTSVRWEVFRRLDINLCFGLSKVSNSFYWREINFTPSKIVIIFQERVFSVSNMFFCDESSYQILMKYKCVNVIVDILMRIRHALRNGMNDTVTIRRGRGNFETFPETILTYHRLYVFGIYVDTQPFHQWLTLCYTWHIICVNIIIR